MTVQFGGGLSPYFQPYNSQMGNVPSNTGTQGMAPSSAMPGGAPGASNPAANNAGHVVNNPTNSMAQTNSMNGYDSSNLSAMSMAQPMSFSPVVFQMGMPMAFVFIAVPIMGFGAFAGAMPGQAPVSSGTSAEGGSEVAPPTAAEIEAPPITQSSTASPDDSVEVDEAVSPAPPGAPTTTGPSAPDIIDVVPVNAKKPTLLIESMQAEDFQRYRQKTLFSSMETSLQLELRTKEGDVISLDFRQLDEVSKESFRGKTIDDGRVRLNEEHESQERIVNMSVEGTLSEEERAAVDSILVAMMDVAREFINGDLDNAKAKLREMDFDTQTLAELSLELSMTSSFESSKAYRRGAEALDRLASRDGEVKQVLEFMANEQKRLMESAREVLDPGSAVRMVQTLLPPLLSEPLNKLIQTVENTEPESGSEETADLSVDAEEPDLQVS